MNCTRERCNVVFDTDWKSTARFGFLGNDNLNYYECESRIGFGTRGYSHDDATCGNTAINGPDNGDKRIKAMGYILMQ